MIETSSSSPATELPVQSLWGRPQAEEPDLLIGALPADTPGLDLAVQQFFARLGSEHPEHETQGTKKESKWGYWAVGTVLTGLTALEFSVRPYKRARQKHRGLERWGGAFASGPSTFILPD